MVSKIDEEIVDQLGSMNISERKRTSKISNPIHIGHHTVSGHEALNLAKRLSEELATQSQTTQPRAISPEVEPISRSYEAKKGKFLNYFVMHFFGKCFPPLIFRLFSYNFLKLTNFFNNFSFDLISRE